MPDFQRLKEFFEPKYIEWKPKNTGIGRNGKPYAMLLAYVTARAIQDRLDDVMGPENWRVEYQHLPNGVMCGLSIKVDKEWITKWDGAEETKIESFKGGISGSIKRAAVLWGIGRYLYDFDNQWAEFVPSEGPDTKQMKIDKTYYYYKEPKLPAWALPKINRQNAPVKPRRPEPNAISKSQVGSAVKKSEIKQTADTHRWPLNDVKEFIQLKYGKERVEDLKHEDFLDLKKTIQTKTATQALAECDAAIEQASDRFNTLPEGQLI